MANNQFYLSNKRRGDGRAQILARVTINRTLGFRIKSSVFVSPDFWDAEAHQVLTPKRGRLNAAKVDEAQAQHAAFNAFATDLVAIIAAAQDTGTIPSKEWVEAALRVKPILTDPRHSFRPDHAGRLYTSENLARALQIDAALKAKEAAPATSSQSLRIHDLCEVYCERQKVCQGRVKTYGTLSRMAGRFEMFVQMTEPRRKKFIFSADTATPDDIEAFRSFITNESSLQNEYPKIFSKILEAFPLSEKYERVIKERGINTIVNLMKMLRAVTRWAYSIGLTDNQPFARVTIGNMQFGEPIYITKEERDKIADYDLSEYPALAVQRDIFIFHCLVGCRIGDLYHLMPANIQDDILTYRPHKTEKKSGTLAIVPLCDRAKALLEKYEGVDCKKRLFPFISEQKYNESIKKIFKKCELTRDVVVFDPKTNRNVSKPIYQVASSHMARRTFVGNTYAQVADPAIVSKMSGHVEGSKAFSRYRKINIDQLKDAISKIQ